ncbi:MAG: tetratricopeptide repeat protein [Vicinamibacterales bacterium]
MSATLRACVLIIVVGTAAFSNSFDNPLLLDDFETVVDNPQIKRLGIENFMPERELPVAGRPLSNATFALNYAVAGEDPTSYHATNFVIHVLCAIVAFVLLRQLLIQPGVPSGVRTHSDFVASVAALLWVVHPLGNEVVNYVTQRTESLMTLFYFLTMYCAIRAAGVSGRVWPSLAVTFCVLGALCKETIATAPLAVFALDSLVVFGSWKDAWRRRWSLYAALASCWVVLAVLQATEPRPYTTGFGTGISAWTYLLNQAEMIVRYLRLAVWPTDLVVFYGPPLPLSLPDVLGQGLLVLAALVATIVACRRWPAVGLAGVWFFLTLAPTSSVLPIATEVGAERRMYLPLIALTTLTAYLIWRLAGSINRSVAVAAVLVLALGTTTFARNREYAAALPLAEVTLERWPSGMARLLVAEELLKVGRRDEALSHLRAAVSEAPRAHYTLGLELYRAGQLEEAVTEFRAFVKEEPAFRFVPDALAMSARALARLGRWDEAMTEAQSALAKAPGLPNAQVVVAEAHFHASRFAEAVGAYRPYLAVRPNDIEATTNLAISLSANGQTADGLAAFQRAADLDTNNWQTRRNLALALLEAGRPRESVVEIRRAIALHTDDSVSHTLLGQGLARVGEMDAAAAAFERALQIDPNDADARGFLTQLRGLGSSAR